MSAIFGVLAVISILTPFFTLKEKPVPANQKNESVWKSLKDVFSNGPFLLILGSWITNTTGVAIIESMLIYYYKYVFNAESSVTLALLILLVVTMAFIPVWIKTDLYPRDEHHFRGSDHIRLFGCSLGNLGSPGCNDRGRDRFLHPLRDALDHRAG
jgi:hypothetical protein